MDSSGTVPSLTSGSLNRRRFLGICGGVAAALGLSQNGFSRTRAASDKPNVIAIMLDDVSAREFGCYGNTSHDTPFVDSLAQNGMRFETCWFSTLCAPSRAMILSGRYAYTTGFWQNNEKPQPTDPEGNIAATHGCFALPIKAAGYATAYYGKWDRKLGGTLAEHGFDEYCVWDHADNNLGALRSQYLAGGGDQHDFPSYTYRPRFWNPLIVEGNNTLGQHTLLPTGDSVYGPDLVTDSLLKFMEAKKDQPFFIFDSMLLAHDESWNFDRDLNACLTQVPQRDAEGNLTGNKLPANLDATQQEYLKYNIEYVDYLTKRIVDKIDALGIRDNTIIMFFGDNGSAVSWTRNGESVPGGKGSAREEFGTRVPLIVNCPGTVPSGTVSGELVDATDFLATFCDLAGADIGDYTHDGLSFAPLLLGKPFDGRHWIHSYHGSDKLFLRDKRWLLDGLGRLWDCGDNRNEIGYVDVTGSTDPEVVAAQERFTALLAALKAGTAVAPGPRSPAPSASPAGTFRTFRSTKTFSYCLRSPASVAVSLQDSHGRTVRRINCGMKSRGTHAVNLGGSIAAGHYVLTISHNGRAADVFPVCITE